MIVLPVFSFGAPRSTANTGDAQGWKPYPASSGGGPTPPSFPAVTWNSEVTSAAILPLSGTSGADLSTLSGWTKVGGTGTVTLDGSGNLNFNSTDTTGVAYSYETGSTTRYIECFQNLQAVGCVSLVLAMIDASNYYGVRLTSGGIDVTGKVAGSFISGSQYVGTVGAASATVGHIRIEVVNNSAVQVYLNGTLRGTYTMPATFAAVTKIGVLSRLTAQTSVSKNYSYGVGRINHGHNFNGVWTGFTAWPVYGNGKVFGGTARMTPGSTAAVGTTQAFSVDATSGTSATYPLSGPNTGYGDEHTGAGLVIRPDGRLIAFYCQHPDTSGMRYKVSVNPYDVSAWSQEYIIPSTGGSNGTTYAQPTYLSADGKVYCFYRGDPNDLQYASSAAVATVGPATVDGGTLASTPAWDTPVSLIPLPSGSTKGIYARIYSDGVSRIDIAATNSVDAAGNKLDVRHAYFTGGSLYGSAGGALTAGTGATFASMTPIATTSAPDNLGNMLVLDVIRRANGHVECLFYTIATAYTVNGHQYWYAVWNGSSWSKAKLDAGTGGGSPDGLTSTIDSPLASGSNGGTRVGGSSLDFNNEGLVYASIGDHYTGTIYAYSTGNGGTSWTRTVASPPANPNPDQARSVDTGNTNSQIYPRSPRNAPTKIAVMWTRGKYDYYDGSVNFAHGEDMFSAGSDGTTLVP